MRIVLASTLMPKSPTEITHSFVFDEITRLPPFGIEVHVVRTLIDQKNSSMYNIHFHELGRKIDPAIIPPLKKAVLSGILAIPAVNHPPL